MKPSAQQCCWNIPHHRPWLISLGGGLRKTQCEGSWKQRLLLFITNIVNSEIIWGKNPVSCSCLTPRWSCCRRCGTIQARVLAVQCFLVRLHTGRRWEEDNQLQTSLLQSHQSLDGGAAKESRPRGRVKPLTCSIKWQLVPNIDWDFLPSYESKIQATFSVTQAQPTRVPVKHHPSRCQMPPSPEAAPAWYDSWESWYLNKYKLPVFIWSKQLLSYPEGIVFSFEDCRFHFWRMAREIFCFLSNNSICCGWKIWHP